MERCYARTHDLCLQLRADVPDSEAERHRHPAVEAIGLRNVPYPRRASSRFPTPGRSGGVAPHRQRGVRAVPVAKSWRDREGGERSCHYRLQLLALLPPPLGIVACSPVANAPRTEQLDPDRFDISP